MYQPSPKILANYAKVLVNFALNSGKGIKKGDVVYLVTQQPGIPLALEVQRAILSCGGQVLLNVLDDRFDLVNLATSTDKQLQFFPDKYYRGLADTVDHWVRILAEEDPMYLRGQDPRRVIMSKRSTKPFRDWLDAKEDAGRFTWTLCLYATPGMAKEAGLSLRDYWKQIENACFLNVPDPMARWREVFAGLQSTLKSLNKLPIDKLHITAKDTDLWITLGRKRRWLGGSGRNIPSFEIFTSPDWRGTQGRIFFDLPLYRYGSIIKDVSLEFSNGKIIKATAGKGEKLLHEMVRQKNADKIGEFSLTDKRFSKITKIMATTLFDENFGGEFGNTHLAVGKSYHDTYAGNAKKMTKKKYEELGFNDSVEHTDIIASSDRRVEATLIDGSTRVIYEHGEFRV